jgi:Tat protein secretion system quality control protein TatD with DNase activity
MTSVLVDAHNHFCGQLPAESPMRQMVVCGTGAGDWERVAAAARRESERVIPAFGVHPWTLAEQPPDWEQRLIALLNEFPAAGVGELGLDRARAGIAPVEAQVAAFRAQLALAGRFGRTVTVHCVRAYGLLETILREVTGTGAGGVAGAGGVNGGRPRRDTPAILLHGYGGSAEHVRSFAGLGCCFSFSANSFSPKNFRAICAVPDDALLLETDAAPDDAGALAMLPASYARAAELRLSAGTAGTAGKPNRSAGNAVTFQQKIAENFQRLFRFTPSAPLPVNYSPEKM